MMLGHQARTTHAAPALWSDCQHTHTQQHITHHADGSNATVCLLHVTPVKDLSQPVLVPVAYTRYFAASL